MVHGTGTVQIALELLKRGVWRQATVPILGYIISEEGIFRRQKMPRTAQEQHKSNKGGG